MSFGFGFVSGFCGCDYSDWLWLGLDLLVAFGVLFGGPLLGGFYCLV